MTPRHPGLCARGAQEYFVDGKVPTAGAPEVEVCGLYAGGQGLCARGLAPMLSVGMAGAQGGYTGALPLHFGRGCVICSRMKPVRPGIRDFAAVLHQSLCRVVAAIGQHRSAFTHWGPYPTRLANAPPAINSDIPE